MAPVLFETEIAVLLERDLANTTRSKVFVSVLITFYCSLFRFSAFFVKWQFGNIQQFSRRGTGGRHYLMVRASVLHQAAEAFFLNAVSEQKGWYAVRAGEGVRRRLSALVGLLVVYQDDLRLMQRVLLWAVNIASEHQHAGWRPRTHWRRFVTAELSLILNQTREAQWTVECHKCEAPCTPLATRPKMETNGRCSRMRFPIS